MLLFCHTVGPFQGGDQLWVNAWKVDFDSPHTTGAEPVP